MDWLRDPDKKSLFLFLIFLMVVNLCFRAVENKKVVTSSNIEVKYIYMSMDTIEVTWVKHLLVDIRVTWVRND